MKNYELSKDINRYNISLNGSDVVIHPANVSSPIINCCENIEISKSFTNITIKERASKSNININYIGNGLNISFNNINVRGNASILNNMTVGGKSVNIGVTESTDKRPVEIILPKETSYSSFDIHQNSGSTTIEELTFQNLNIQTNSGNILLNDVDLLLGKIKTLSGKVDVKILESMLNYIVSYKTLSGRSTQVSEETEIPFLLKEKHKLDVETLSGNIDIVFKGKNR